MVHFFVFFRTAGRMEKDLMRGPPHTLLVRYHHSSLLCRNVQWRNKELASLPASLSGDSVVEQREHGLFLKCVRLWNLTAVQLCRLFPPLDLSICLYRTAIPPNPEELWIVFWEEISSLFFDRKVNCFLSPSNRKVKGKIDLWKLKKFLTFYRTLIQNQRVCSTV